MEAALKVAEYMFRHMRQVWERLGIEWRQRFQKATCRGTLRVCAALSEFG